LKTLITFANFVIIFSIIFVSQQAVANPQRVEIWFLSPPLAAKLNDVATRANLLAQTQLQNFTCVPMGEGCFHPQYGYTDKFGVGIIRPFEEKDFSDVALAEEEGSFKTIGSFEKSGIECDKSNYFDIYCGKAFDDDYETKVEIWVDTSSGLSSVDYSRDSDYCFRRSFVSRVVGQCQKNLVSVSTFDSSLKQMGALSSLCVSHGISDQDRLISWIKNSKIRYLLIITDIGEYTAKMDSFLKEIGAYVRGGNQGFLAAKDLDGLTKQVTSACDKISKK